MSGTAGWPQRHCTGRKFTEGRWRSSRKGVPTEGRVLQALEGQSCTWGPLLCPRLTHDSSHCKSSCPEEYRPHSLSDVCFFLSSLLWVSDPTSMTVVPTTVQSPSECLSLRSSRKVVSWKGKKLEQDFQGTVVTLLHLLIGMFPSPNITSLKARMLLQLSLYCQLLDHCLMSIIQNAQSDFMNKCHTVCDLISQPTSRNSPRFTANGFRHPSKHMGKKV